MIYVCARDTARIAAELPPRKRLNTQNKLIIKGLQTLKSQMSTQAVIGMSHYGFTER